MLAKITCSYCLILLWLENSPLLYWIYWFYCDCSCDLNYSNVLFNKTCITIERWVFSFISYNGYQPIQIILILQLIEYNYFLFWDKRSTDLFNELQSIFLISVFIWCNFFQGVWSLAICILRLKVRVEYILANKGCSDITKWLDINRLLDKM